jgi:IS5 family transposase
MAAKRIPLGIWQRILQATISVPHLAAMDGTGMSRSLPSPYYYRRIDKPYPVEVPLKLSILIDTRTKKILALRLRAKRAHDIKDARYLLRRSPRPKCLVADKAYDAEWLHELCRDKKIEPCIPIRKGGKPRVGSTRLRYTAAKKFNERRYHRRAMVESVFSAIKRKFGASIGSVRISAQRAEMYCRAIAHNISLWKNYILNAALSTSA